MRCVKPGVWVTALLIPLTLLLLWVSTSRSSGSPLTLGYYQTARLSADDLAEGDAFGSSVALDGNTLILGVPQDDDLGMDSGSAYVMKYDPATKEWYQLAKLHASDAGPSHIFGASVAIQGDTAFVGAPVHPPGGVVYVFERNQGGVDAWGEVRQIVGDQVSWVDHFGISMDISGDLLIVGAYGGGNYDGEAYIFERDQAGQDAWGQVAYLVPVDNPAYNYFGFSVAISGDTVAGGAPGYNGVTGAAYIFERQSDDTWLEVTQLTPEDGAFHDFFGIAVDLDGDILAAGSPGHTSATPTNQVGGAVYLFERNQGGPDSWGQRAKLLASDGVLGDGFGQDVLLDQGLLFTGATGHQESAGAVYIFAPQPSGAGIWEEVSKLMADEPMPGEGLGNSLALDGLFLLAGAPGVVPGGAVDVFMKNSPPRVLNFSLSPNSISEGSHTLLTGSFDDPDLEDHDLLVEWGDSFTNTLHLPAETQVFTLTHVYLDDLPFGTALDPYTVTVTISDTCGSTIWAQAFLQVENVLPTIFLGPDTFLQPGNMLQRAGSFSDPGADTWAGWVDYGDGSSLQPLALTGQDFWLEHGYLFEGYFDVTVTVNDDDGGQGHQRFKVRVSDQPYWYFLPAIQR